MLRVPFKNEEYFNEYIEKSTEELKETKELLNDKRVLKERLCLLIERIFELKLHIIVAEYSRGDDIDTLRLDYKSALELWRETSFKDKIEYYYTINLWFVSLTVLLDMGDDIVETVKRKLEQENINDWLLNFILAKGEKEPAQIEGQLLVPKESQALKNAICASDKNQLIHYLEKEWYSNFKDCGWYDSHKLSKRNFQIYFGYWCFEAAAVMKLLKWDDSDLVDQQYYPYDLAHYKK